jgi:hypothetical protein
MKHEGSLSHPQSPPPVPNPSQIRYTVDTNFLPWNRVGTLNIDLQSIEHVTLLFEDDGYREKSDRRL